MKKARAARLIALGLIGLAAKNWRDAAGVRPPENARSLLVDGLRIYVIDEGSRDAPCIVVLHGSAGSCWDYNALVDELRTHYRVVVPERPGQGWSSQPASYRLAGATNTLYETLRQLDVERPVLVGHSYGGLLAMRLAVDHPEYPAGLLLLCSGGPGLTLEGHHMERWVRLANAALNSRAAGTLVAWTAMPYLARLLTTRALRGNFGPDYERLSDDDIRHVKKIYSRPGIILASMREGACVQDDLTALIPLLDRIKAPTLVVTAELDRNVPPAVGAATAKAIPGARSLELPGVAHNFPVSRPYEVARLLQELDRTIRTLPSGARRE